MDEIPTRHDEAIHGLRYDYYGKKLVTCSSDQKIKVWEQDESGSWRLTADWKGHKGSIWRAEWVHPRFGSVLVTCSFDQSVKVWQETEEEKGTYLLNKTAALKHLPYLIY